MHAVFIMKTDVRFKYNLASLTVLKWIINLDKIEHILLLRIDKN